MCIDITYILWYVCIFHIANICYILYIPMIIGKDHKFEVGLEDTRGEERKSDMIQKSNKISNQISQKIIP